MENFRDKFSLYEDYLGDPQEWDEKLMPSEPLIYGWRTDTQKFRPSKFQTVQGALYVQCHVRLRKVMEQCLLPMDFEPLEPTPTPAFEGCPKPTPSPTSADTKVPAPRPEGLFYRTLVVTGTLCHPPFTNVGQDLNILSFASPQIPLPVKFFPRLDGTNSPTSYNDFTVSLMTTVFASNSPVKLSMNLPILLESMYIQVLKSSQAGLAIFAGCFWFTLAFIKDVTWSGLCAFSMGVSTLFPKCFVQDKYGCFLACSKLKSAVPSFTTAVGAGAFYSPEQLPGGGCMHSYETRQEWITAANNGDEQSMLRLLAIKPALLEKKDKNDYERTALHKAADKGHESVARMLLERGADLNARDQQKRTPLYQATYSGYESVVRLLLERGADPNAVDYAKWTPLQWAVRLGYVSIIQQLLEHGATSDPSLLQMAKERAFTGVASLLARQADNDSEAVFLEKGRFRPVYVCTVQAFLSMPRLLKHEEALSNGDVIELPVDASVVFFSHRWLAGTKMDAEGPHPDKEDNYKHQAMQHAIKHEFSHATHVWVDYLCVPQLKEHAQDQLLAINSLPYIVRQCTDFVVLHGESGIKNKHGEDEASYLVYNSRGWCRLECLSALAPFEEEGREIRKWRLNMDTQEVEQPDIFEGDLSAFNPFGKGAVFFDRKDKNKIALMVYNLAKAFPQDYGIVKAAVKYFPADLKKKYEEYGSI